MNDIVEFLISIVNNLAHDGSLTVQLQTSSCLIIAEQGAQLALKSDRIAG
jgi:hypothetical protein